jgi:cytoskeletal protein RodZ
MNPVIKPISVVLKEARQNKGISLDEAYKATKIHPTILHALEEGTTLGLSHVYVKSYIKIYAHYLGISSHELNRYFPAPAALKERRVKLDVSSIGDKGEKIQGLSNLVILPGPPILVNVLKRLIVVLGIVLIFVIIVKYFPKKDKAILEKGKTATTALAKVATPAIDKESFPKITDKLRLTISTEKDSWMRVKVDGKTAFMRVLKAGTSETWQAKDSIELWLANAGIIKLELNGKILPPIGRRGQLLKSVVITREGLVINK